MQFNFMNYTTLVIPNFQKKVNLLVLFLLTNDKLHKGQNATMIVAWHHVTSTKVLSTFL